MNRNRPLSPKRAHSQLWNLLLALFTTLGLGAVASAQNLPLAATANPAPGSLLVELVRINVVFSEAVTGVEAADLLVNDIPASEVTTNNPNDYTFTIIQPKDGAVDVSWAPGHGIASSSPLATPFLDGVWSYVLDSQLASTANFAISEFMASNSTGILDEDGARSDWIELVNLGTEPASLEGWFLTDTQLNPTRWRFPSGLPPVPGNGYLLIWASGRNRTNAFAPLHTDFRLPASGSYIALVNPNTNVVSSFAPYPTQVADVSYGRDLSDAATVGYFTNATPGKINATSGPGFLPEPTFSLTSGVYTNDTLTLTISAPTGAIRYTLNGSIPVTTSTLYTNTLTLSNSTLIKVRVFPPAGTKVFPSAVAARNILFLDGSTRDFNSELPLLVISTQGQGVAQDVPPGGKRTEGILCLIDTFQGRSSLQTTPDFIGNVGVEVFGQTSAGFPKLPYRIEVHDALGNDLDIPIFGLPAESDWKLRNPFNDKSLVNDFLGYELFEQMGHYSCRRRLVEVFVDSGGGRLRYPTDYIGVETLFESIKQGENRVNIAKIPPTATNGPAITGGYVFAKDKNSPGDLDFSTRGGSGFGGQTLKLHEPKPNEMRVTPVSGRLTPGGSNQLAYLVGYLNRMERAMYTNTWLSQTGTNHYSAYLDVDSFVDFHWLVEFTKQIDGIRLSTYFTKDRDDKLHAGPVWDWNLAFGNANYWRGGLTNGWYYAQDDVGMNADAHIWLRRLINGSAALGPVISFDLGNGPGVGGDPDFNQRISDRWGVLRTNLFNPTNIMARIDELSLMLEEATTRDLWGKYRSQIVGMYTWPNPEGTLTPVNTTDFSGRDVDYVHPLNYRGTTENSIIGQMKKFMLGRYLWIDSQFTRPPTLTDSGGNVSSGHTVTVSPPAGATLYYTLDGTDPRAPGGSVASGVISNSGPATVTIAANTRIVARAYQTNSWYRTWSGPSAASFILETPSLRITEVLYHPADAPLGSTNASSDFEFVEVKNTGTGPLNLKGYTLGGGVNFSFPDLTLPPNARAVAVANVSAFSTRYPDPQIVVAGQFNGSLNNTGDRVTLVGPLHEPIQDFTYNPHWYPATDGAGFALVATDENALGSGLNARSAWAPGSVVNGTPGKPETATTVFPQVVINELQSRSTSPAGDRVELLNTGANPVDVGGWYLTDNLSSPKKYRLPPATTIPAGGFRVFQESAFNTGATSFAFSSLGEEVYLFSADAAGNLTGYAHGFSFGAQFADQSFGRYVGSDGVEHFVTQSGASFDGANPGPKVGPVVISEIHYHPPEIFKYGGRYDDSFHEFVELKNISSSSVVLSHVLYPTNSWILRGPIEFAFPSGTAIPALGSLVVVGFDPANAPRLAAFRDRFGIAATVPVLGPWKGSLPNNQGKVELAQPDEPIAAPSSNAGLVPYLTVDSVSYSDDTPWPPSADGRGASLHRISLASFGDDPANWAAAAPAPGTEFTPASAPTIVQQPTDLTVVLTNGAVATFTVAAQGSGSLTYQWLFNGVVLPEESGTSLSLANLNPAKAGRYSVAVLGSGGGTVSAEAQLDMLQPVTILAQPKTVGGRPGTNAVLSVGAASSLPIQYQWYKDGLALPGATSAQLSLPNLGFADDGQYQVQVSDAISSVLSDRVRVAVLVNPRFLVQPQGQSVIRGGSVILSAVVSNTTTTPIGYRWRRNGITFTTQVTNILYSYQVVTNIQASANYSVQVTNLALRLGTNSANAFITVVDDTDKDGLPDEYEALYPGFLGASDAADAARDQDGDGMTNLAEYIAGTDPTDALSFLRVESIQVAGGGTQLELYARSNRTYTVEFRESVGLGTWQSLTNLPAQPTDRLEIIQDPYPATGSRIYRIATPVRADRAIRTPIILQSPSSLNANQGSAVLLEVSAFGIGGLQYQWRMNELDIPGANGSTLAFNSVQPADQGRYSVKITDATGSVTTESSTLAVLEPPQIVSAPLSQTVRVGESARFQVGATGSATLTYRWLFNDQPLTGANGPILQLDAVTAANVGTYQVVISQVTANGPVSTRSEPVELIVLE
jgi:hypothetical protein